MGWSRRDFQKVFGVLFHVTTRAHPFHLERLSVVVVMPLGFRVPTRTRKFLNFSRIDRSSQHLTRPYSLGKHPLSLPPLLLFHLPIHWVVLITLFFPASLFLLVRGGLTTIWSSFVFQLFLQKFLWVAPEIFLLFLFLARLAVAPQAVSGLRVILEFRTGFVFLASRAPFLIYFHRTGA